MKQFKYFAFVLVAIIFAANTQAQTKENPHGIRIAGGVMDGYGPENGSNFPYGIWNTDNLDEAFQIQYSKYMNEFIDLGLNVSASDVENLWDDDFSPDPLTIGSSVDLDLFARYKFYNGVDIKEDALIRPFIYTGASGTYISSLDRVKNVDNGLGMNVPLGAGFKIAVSDKVNIDYSGAFRIGLFNKIPNRWEHLGGLTFNVGTPKVEEVPPAPAPVPPPPPKDTDKDGIIDVEDECPTVPGVARLNGCPEPVDTDGDGIPDEEDECPTVAGIPSLNGCPAPVDTDGDGIVDEEDDCPDVPGVASRNGCPEPEIVVVDTDGDGIPDDRDACPNVFGVYEQNGCPEKVVAEDMVIIEEISKNIFFEFDSATIKGESKQKLNNLVELINRYPNFNLNIEGHTDSAGAAAYNQTLSEKRAAAVRDYLTSNGVASARVTSVGYGENRPIADNSTAAGRAKNRRVVLDLKLKK